MEIQGQQKLSVSHINKAFLDADHLLMKTKDIEVLDDVYKSLLLQILNPHPQKHIITISGMGGLGKTTLSKYIYDSVDMIYPFDLRVWVHYDPPALSTESLFISIKKSLQKAEKDKDELQEIEDGNNDLEGYIVKFLGRRRCLVGIENVWDDAVLKLFEKALEENNNGSMLIITTRKKSLAIENKHFIHHELRFMTPEESWNLFCKKFSETKQEKHVFSPAKEILAKEMLEKCNGLPLAIVELAKVLSKDNELKAWYKVEKEIWKQMKLASSNIFKLLNLSYIYLPTNLQYCFLYITRFPEGFQIDVEQLKNLWMDEGLVTNKDDAAKFVQELIDWNLIQVSGTLWDKVTTCRLHGLMRELAIPLQKFKEEYLSDVERYALHGPLPNYAALSLQKTDVSAQLLFKRIPKYLTKKLFTKKDRNYRKKEVFDSKGLANTSDSAGGKYRCRLPIEGVNMLQAFKVIDSDQQDVLKSSDIKKLIIWCKNEELTLNFVNCQSVETLILISSHETLPRPISLEECPSLKRLWVHGSLMKTPNLDYFPPSLKSLILSKSRFTSDPMETLEKLPCLSNLELKNSYIGKKIVSRRNGFPKLEVLRMSNLYELEEWVIEEEAMPKLRGLGIFECYKLKKPETLKSIPEVRESEADYYLQKMING